MPTEAQQTSINQLMNKLISFPPSDPKQDLCPGNHPNTGKWAFRSSDIQASMNSASQSRISQPKGNLACDCLQDQVHMLLPAFKVLLKRVHHYSVISYHHLYVCSQNPLLPSLRRSSARQSSCVNKFPNHLNCSRSSGAHPPPLSSTGSSSNTLP